MDDAWRTRTEKHLQDLDKGQLHIIGRLDEQDKTLAQGGKIMRQLLDETVEVRRIVSGTKWTARFITVCGRGLYFCARHLAPILVVGLAIWGAIWAWLHGGKPPSVG